MSPEETKNASDQQHLGRSRKQEIEALHALLVRELRRRESAASQARTGQTTVPAPARKSIGAAFTGLVLAVVVPRLVGLAVWGSIYDEPQWWNIGSAVLIVAGIVDVIAALKSRVTAA